MQLALKEPSAALLAFERALESAPGTVEAVAGSSMAYLELAKPWKVLELLDADPGLERTYPPLAELRIYALRRMGRTTQGHPVSSVPQESALGHFLQGLNELQNGEDGLTGCFEHAAECFRSAILLSRHARPIYFYEFAHAAGHSGNAAMAREAASLIVALWGACAEARFWTGFALKDVDVNRAISELETATRLNPRMVEAHRWIGNLRREPMAAITSYRSVLELNPGDSRARRTLILELLKVNRLDEAQRELEGLTDSGDVRFMVASALDDAGRIVEAIEEYRKSVANKPEHVVYLSLGLAALKLERLSDAVDALSEATRLDPTAAHAYVPLSEALRRSGRMEDAVRVLEEALRNKPGYHPARISLACALVDTGRAAEGIAIMYAGVERNPQDLEALCNLGQFLRERGEPDKAVSPLQTAVGLDPDSREAHLGLSGALLEANDFEAARRELDRWTAINSEDANAWHELAMALVVMGRNEDFRDVDAALQAATKAADLSNRKDPSILLGLVRALQQADRRAEAAEVASAALALIPGLPQSDADLREALQVAAARAPVDAR